MIKEYTMKSRDNLKILLFFPNTANEGVAPLAVASLTAVARKNNCDIRYFESSFYELEEWLDSASVERKISGEFKRNKNNVFELKENSLLYSDFSEIINNFKPDILAVTANSMEYELFLNVMDRSQLSHNPYVIVGGCHATVDPDNTINNKYVDAICIAEGENPWDDIISKFKTGDDISEVDSCWVKTDRGIRKNAANKLLSAEELWEHHLDFSFFDDRHFRYVFDGKLYRRGSLELSRGCPYDCTYCVNTGFKEIYKGLGKFLRIRPFDNIRHAAKDLVENYGINMIAFQDESFLSIPMKTLEEFCEWYGSEVKIPFMMQARPETIKPNKIELLAEINIPIQISVGIESGSQRVLREICNRKTKVEAIRQSFDIIKEYGLRTTAYTMIGFPTETRKEVFETIDLVRSCDIDVSIMSVFFPFKGTPLRDLCIEKGYISGSESAASFTGDSILKNQPMSPQEISGIRRCYALYTKLPKEYYHEIELCEKDYHNNRELYNNLVKIVNNSYSSDWLTDNDGDLEIANSRSGESRGQKYQDVSWHSPDLIRAVDINTS